LNLTLSLFEMLPGRGMSNDTLVHNSFRPLDAREIIAAR
jgi:hypothetical protein